MSLLEQWYLIYLAPLSSICCFKEDIHTNKFQENVMFMLNFPLKELLADDFFDTCTNIVQENESMMKSVCMKRVGTSRR